MRVLFFSRLDPSETNAGGTGGVQWDGRDGAVAGDRGGGGNERNFPLRYGRTDGTRATNDYGDTALEIAS